MSAELDELFGKEVRPQPRTVSVIVLAVTTLLLTAIGLMCSVIPAYLPALAAWNIAETDTDRLQEGYLGVESTTQVAWARRSSYVLLVGLSLVLIAQGYLVTTGFYAELWSGMLLLLLGPPT